MHSRTKIVAYTIAIHKHSLENALYLLTNIIFTCVMYKIQKYLNILLSTATCIYFLILIVLPGVWSRLIVQSLKLILGTKGTLFVPNIKGKGSKVDKSKRHF